MCSPFEPRCSASCCNNPWCRRTDIPTRHLVLPRTEIPRGLFALRLHQPRRAQGRGVGPIDAGGFQYPVSDHGPRRDSTARDLDLRLPGVVPRRRDEQLLRLAGRWIERCRRQTHPLSSLASPGAMARWCSDHCPGRAVHPGTHSSQHTVSRIFLVGTVR